MTADPRWAALGGYFGQVLFMAVTAFVVARQTDDPEVSGVADALAGSAIVIYLPIVLLVALQWRTLAARGSAAPGAAGAGVEGGESAEVLVDLGDANSPTAREDRVHGH